MASSSATGSRAWPGVTAFYDIDTPVTLAALERGDCAYLEPRQVASYDVYLSFTGARPSRASSAAVRLAGGAPALLLVRPALYYPESRPDAAGTSATSAPTATIGSPRSTPAARARPALAGRALHRRRPAVPETIEWPANVERREIHVEPKLHRGLLHAQRFTLNVTRADMVRAGWSPSVRLFEAAACGVPDHQRRLAGTREFFAPGATSW
jgi:spore maturation protein CgeB